jgi:hypothetical protein
MPKNWVKFAEGDFCKINGSKHHFSLCHQMLIMGRPPPKKLLHALQEMETNSNDTSVRPNW